MSSFDNRPIEEREKSGFDNREVIIFVDDWLLLGGIWSDSGKWIDSEVWND